MLGDGTLKTTQVQIAHGQGYIPFFIAYVDDFVTNPNSQWGIVPYRNSTLTLERKAEVYADSTYLNLKLFNKSLSTYTARFYYKIYKESSLQIS